MLARTGNHKFGQKTLTDSIADRCQCSVSMQSETAILPPYVRSQTIHRIPGFARFAKVILVSPRQQLLYLLHTGYATANHNPNLKL